MIKGLYIGLFLILIAAVLFGFQTKQSFKEEDVHLNNEKILQANVSLEEENPYLNAYFINEFENTEQLFQKSDLVVIGHVGEKREPYNQAIRSSFIVEHVVKNDSPLSSLPKQIFIYEPSYFVGSTYVSVGGYQLMLDYKKYILFLNHLKVPNGYQLRGKEKMTFLPLSTYYGKFSLESCKKTLPVGPDIDLTYREIKNYCILTTDHHILHRYRKFKKEIQNVIHFNASVLEQK